MALGEGSHPPAVTAEPLDTPRRGHGPLRAVLFVSALPPAEVKGSKMSTRTPLPTVNERDTENVSSRVDFPGRGRPPSGPLGD